MSLHVRDVRVEYPGAQRAAVDGVTLDVATGEVLAVVGPSGCGKSSLLRAIAGVEPLAGGDVLWDDESVATVPVHRRRFGLMFQDGQLFAHQDVGTNVAYGLAAARAPRAERAARVAELLELVGLGGWERRAVATLSGGERQRVALARALAPRPRLLLLDEPLSALDRELRERLARDLRDVLAVTGTTAIFVTHDQDEACQVADRIAVMAHGRVLQVAEPAELWAAPASEQVATFWGMETIVDAGHPLHGALLAAVRGTGRQVDPDARFAMASGAAVASAELVAPIDGVPPEDGVGSMHPHAIPQQRGGEPAATGVVRRVVQQRGGVLLDVEVLAVGHAAPGTAGAASAVVVAAAVGNDVWQVGQRVSLVIDPRRVAVLPD